MKKNLYQFLEQFYFEIYFDYTDFNVENFIKFVRDKKISKDLLSDEELRRGFLDLRNEKGEKIEKNISKEALDVLKKYLSNYKDREDKLPLSQLEIVAAMFFYTNNFPIIWNNYIEQKDKNKIKFLNFNKEEDKQINNIKKIYEAIFDSILSTNETRKKVFIDKLLKQKEVEIEQKIEEKILKNLKDDNLLSNLFVYFKKKSKVEKIKKFIADRIMKKKEQQDKIINLILEDIKNNRKINISNVIELNKLMIKEQSNFYDKIFHTEIIFIPEYGVDSQELVKNLMNKIGYKVNNQKLYSEIKLN